MRLSAVRSRTWVEKRKAKERAILWIETGALSLTLILAAMFIATCVVSPQGMLRVLTSPYVPCVLGVAAIILIPASLWFDKFKTTF